MSELAVAELAHALSADLGLPYAVVPWTRPLHAAIGPTPALRRAVRELVAQPEGGLLILQVVHDRFLPAQEPSRRVLLAALGGTAVVDTHAVPCLDGLAIAVTLASAQRRTPIGDLAPVEGAELLALRPDAAVRLAPLVRRAALAGVDEDLEPDTRVLVAAGAATLHDGGVVPTVAGLVAFGTNPASFLGGLHAIVEGTRVTRVSGDPISLIRAVVRELRLLEPAIEAARSLVLHALISRSWLPHRDDDPIRVLASGRWLEVRWSACTPDCGPANPTLRSHLRARRVLHSFAEDLAQLEAWLRARGGSRPAVVDEGDERVVRVRLPPSRPIPTDLQMAPVVDPPVEAPAVAAPPGPVVVAAAPLLTHVDADTRDAAALAVFERKEPVSARDLMQALGWSRSTTRDVLARLVAAGSVAGTAASARSPHQTYVRNPKQVGPRG